MKLLVLLLIFSALGYGVLRIMHSLVRELAEITAEAWHIGDT
ncbi:hypothetical protein [Methylomonas sp. MgM2]